MAEYITATILGIVEGLTEFLPISSTGHLILVNQFFSFDKDFTLLFDIFIQLGAILAVLVYFRKKLWHNPNIWYKTIIGVLPAILVGAVFGGFAEEKLFNPWVVAGALAIGGIIILLVDRNQRESGKINSIENLSLKTAFLIGLVQCLALIPGTSRSATTIIGAMIFGASRIVATEFSFFLAIPTIFAASAYSLIKFSAFPTIQQILVLSLGFIVSFAVAFIVIKFLINYVQKNNFKIFGYYRIILGIIIIAYFVWKIF